MGVRVGDQDYFILSQPEYGNSVGVVTVSGNEEDGGGRRVVHCVGEHVN